MEVHVRKERRGEVRLTLGGNEAVNLMGISKITVNAATAAVFLQEVTKKKCLEPNCDSNTERPDELNSSFCQDNYNINPPPLSKKKKNITKNQTKTTI